MTPRLTRLTRVAVLFCIVGFVGSAVIACSADTSSDRRSTGPNDKDGGANDADAQEAATPDPNDGRDETSASCYAACQNATFGCQPKGGSEASTAEMTPDATGCSGTITPTGGAATTLKLDCEGRKVCLGDPPSPTCVSGTFSAFSFAYTPASGGALNVCTRN